MQGGVGVWGVAAILGVVVVVAAVLAVLHFQFGFFRRGKSRRPKSERHGNSRIEVLESTYVDHDRQLVLVRCDRIEHLILVGGPADLVVENDVKKVRGPGAPAAARTPVPESGELFSGSLFESTGGASAQPAAPEHPAPPAAERRPLPQRSGPAPSIDRTPERAPETREQRQRPGESQFGRREPTPSPRRTIQPAPLGGNRSEPTRAPQAPSRSNGRRGSEPSPTLPPAGVPWAASDSIENEIVQALRVDPVPRGGEAPAHPHAPAASGRDTSDATTLGDLADKLEEALAQEVQSARSGPPEPATDEFGFDAPARESPREAPREPPPRERLITNRMRQQKPEPTREAPPKAETTGPSPEPERRRERESASERREEAPVISLNARRRESSDSLEDEMARLLGELTGDTKGR
jgi:flagellar protein FliO/FliZ